MTVDEKQQKELIAAFRTESMEHIDAISRLFEAIKKGESDDLYLHIEKARLESRALMETAAALGFVRIKEMAFQLFEALDALASKKTQISSKVVDVLVTAIDALRTSAIEAVPDAERPSKIEGVESRSPTSDPDTPAHAASKRREAMSGLQQDQFDQLAAVFRAESAEHLKTLSELLISLEQGEGETTELLTRAFREAHSLKGSAGTLGYFRVEAVTHKLEDVLGQLMSKSKNISGEEADLLLSALDLISESVNSSELGDEQLSGKESMIARALEDLTVDLTRSVSKSGRDEPNIAFKKAAEPRSHEETGVFEPPYTGRDKSDGARRKEKPQEEIVRISQDKIDTVIARIFELFEVNLQLESLTPELYRFGVMAQEITEMLGELESDLDGTNHRGELHSVIEKVSNLTTQLKVVSKQFERDERLVSKLILSSQEDLRKIRMAPVSSIFTTVRRQVRGISRTTGKPLDLELNGGEYMVDRKVLEAIEEPLIHILRNAASHGIEEPDIRKQRKKSEAGRIGVTARHMGDAVEITIADDGGGIDPEMIRDALLKKKTMWKEQVEKLSIDQLMDHLFEPGFSTQQGISKISGRGIGLDVVKYIVEHVGGEVRLESEKGVGTAITLRLPLAMSTVRCLLVRIAGRVVAIPAANINKVVVPSSEDLKLVGGGEVIIYKDQTIPLGSLADVLKLASGGFSSPERSKLVLIVSFGERRFAFVVDELIEYTQLILKPLGDLLERVPNISGISLLGTGETALVLNPADLVRSAGGIRKEGSRPIFPTLWEPTKNKRILVVDDSIATRTLERTLLESAGFSVLTASDGYKALDLLATNRCDVVLSDVIMPNMDGIELTRAIKSRPKLSHLPVILITSLGSDEDKSRGLDAGADAYLVKKELTQNELVETINQLL
jgi:two-component system chemotaxis sensor kinase CheA